MVEKQKEVRSYLAKFWTQEWKLTWLFLAVTFDAIIGYPLASMVSSNILIQIINDVIISVIFVLGLFALIRRKTIRRVFGGIIIIVIAVRLMRFVFASNFLAVWSTLLTLGTVVAFVTLILKYVYKEGTVTWQRVEGAVTAYMLSAVAFSLAYLLISFLTPMAFRFSDKVAATGDPTMWYDFYYFSIVTLTTLGYGDIIPVHPVARTLAVTEALVGQLYPAILLARLVSLYVVHSHGSDK